MLLSKLSNVPFLDGADGMYRTTNKSHFKLFDNTSIMKTKPVSRPASPHFHFGDHKNLPVYQTETALSFPSHPAKPVEPKFTKFTMQLTNFKMEAGDWCGNFQTTQSDFKPMPMSAAQIIRPTSAVKIKMSDSKCPQTIYKSCYTKHKVLPIIKAKATINAGVEPALKQYKKENFSSSYDEQFQYRRGPKSAPLQSTEKQRSQYSSVAMGDKEKILDKITTYSISFTQSEDHSSAKFRECLLPKIEKTRHLNLRELPEDKWATTSSDEFCAHTYGPIHLEHRSPTISSVFKGEMLNTDEEKLTTNQCFYPKINNTMFPSHVNGAKIRMLSNVKFGRPNLAKRFYSTTTHNEFPSKEAVRPKPEIYPPSYMLCEQEPDRMLTTIQKDFVPLNSRRQELSPSQLQQVKECHIRPRHSKHDFRTTHKEVFVPKPFCKAVLDNPPLQHISHMLF